jgi:hypothetical protein
MVSTCFLMLDCVLICLDLADDPIGLPSFSEDKLRDDDAMMVDDNCK